jgi:hypothetical protein
MPTRRKTTGESGRSASAHDTPALPTEQSIARRAYELFVERGCVHGRDLDDWLSAERELLAAPRSAAARGASPDTKMAGRPRHGSLLRMPSRTSGRGKGGKD